MGDDVYRSLFMRGFGYYMDDPKPEEIIRIMDDGEEAAFAGLIRLDQETTMLFCIAPLNKTDAFQLNGYFLKLLQYIHADLGFKWIMTEMPATARERIAAALLAGFIIVAMHDPDASAILRLMHMASPGMPVEKPGRVH